MPIHNAEITTAIDHLANLLEIEGANPFRVRAYRGAARTIEDLPLSAAEMLAAGEDLAELSGIGAELAGKIASSLPPSTSPYWKRQNRACPPGLVELTYVPGIGPERAHQLYDKLKIRSV